MSLFQRSQRERRGNAQRQTDRYLQVASVAPPEVQDQAFEDQLSNLGELGIDDGDNGGVNVSEDGRGRLSLQHRASQRTPDERRDRK